MYSEEIKYLSFGSDEDTHSNEIRNTYFSNRSCLTNVLDFLNQEVVIIAGPYFSYQEGGPDIYENSDTVVDDELDEEWDNIYEKIEIIDKEDCYHLSVSDNYVTIVANNRRCIFTNTEMEEGDIFATIFWVENYSELLETFHDKDLKKISKAIILPHEFKNIDNQDRECLDLDFFLSLKIIKPETIFKYTINSFMENECLDVYKKWKV
ncbi:hypothetical protein CONCODRAFT_4473 [Conidiobolus coronatus NRRL 28638]|uniref:Uncharacterized protein n=1 Tax=Conidiobolus coronatus (strain ATCC 28846 / CBS 209.66 / NRRL 28638) TaxID=796925 RepID=A0A137PCK9_CONC2|nr:hypothetical protein CONCODRAFT_4473 [Conidiobolus coronatus NRRL 28638]|eukprot:KXN72738.1 hypothetical protein CONCODRAFT_4473 [Conidiobolus coronatus NRRL 28638]